MGLYLSSTRTAFTFGVAAPVPWRCTETENILKGKKITEEMYQELEDSIRQEINPRDSWRASRAFRLQIAGEIAKRALKKTVELAEQAREQSKDGGDRT